MRKGEKKMATILEKYTQAKTRAMEQVTAGKLPMDQLLAFQELLYRTNILETCMCLCKTAPVSLDTKMLSHHYKVLESYLMCLVKEHPIGLPADEKLRTQRETAQGNLQQIIQSARKQFSSFAPSNEEQYKAAVTKVISTVILAWIQYRDTFTKV